MKNKSVSRISLDRIQLNTKRVANDCRLPVDQPFSNIYKVLLQVTNGSVVMSFRSRLLDVRD